MPWVLLVVAGSFEIVWATSMKASAGFTRPWPGAVTIVAMPIPFTLLAAAMRSLPPGTAYAVWTGIGAVGAFVPDIVALASRRRRCGWWRRR